ncbi:MAG: HD domain-containing protein, partial [Oscillospiraceae bacterium]|nr:HD domain-containing protein [Oscillospiraceae bacterium]
MSQLTLEQAKALLATTTTQPHLFEHAIGVSSAMGAMAAHFGEDAEYWQAVGWLHDYDYEQFPEEHLDHTANELRAAGVEDEVAIRAILSHGYTLRNDVEPITNM